MVSAFVASDRLVEAGAVVAQVLVPADVAHAHSTVDVAHLAHRARIAVGLFSVLDCAGRTALAFSFRGPGAPGGTVDASVIATHFAHTTRYACRTKDILFEVWRANARTGSSTAQLVRLAAHTVGIIVIAPSTYRLRTISRLISAADRARAIDH